VTEVAAFAACTGVAALARLGVCGVDAAALLRLAEAVPVLAWVLSLPRWLLLLDVAAALGVLAFELPLLLLGPAAALVALPGLAFPLLPELALLPLPPALLLPLPALAPPPPRSSAQRI
jgi:hypothetical protein